MDWTYYELSELPWPWIERLDVDIYYTSDAVDKAWNGRMTLTKKDLIFWRKLGTIFSVFSPNPDSEDVVLEIVDDSYHLVLSMILLKVHCKAGLSLKNPFDIAELFFDDYNPMLDVEWERKWDQPWLWS